MKLFLHGKTEHGAGYSWLGASPAPPAADVPAQGSGQAKVGHANTRMSFSRSEDISLLIAVDMPGWRLFVSLGTATELSWSSTPTTGHGEHPGHCAHPLPRWGLMSQSSILGSSSTSVMQPHPGKCSLLSPWVLSRARLSKGAGAASETFWEGLSNLGAFCNTGGNDQADTGSVQRLPRLPLCHWEGARLGAAAGYYSSRGKDGALGLVFGVFGTTQAPETGLKESGPPLFKDCCGNRVQLD